MAQACCLHRNKDEEDARSLQASKGSPDGSKRISALDKAKNSETSRVPTMSSSSDGSPRPHDSPYFEVKDSKKEPGELSSEDGIATNSEISKSVNDSLLADTYADCGSPKLKKQKFPTIFWDLNDLPVNELAIRVGESTFASLEKTPVCDIAESYSTTNSTPSVEGKFAGVKERAVDMESNKEDHIFVDKGAQEVPLERTSPWPRGIIDQNENKLNNKSEGGVRHKEEIDKDYARGSDEEMEHSEVDVEEEEQVPVKPVANMLPGCRSVNEFERLDKINEGTYGVVYRARNKLSGEIVALKKVKLEKETEGFPITSLREINILLSLHHPSIVDLKEVVVGHDVDSIFVVMEYMEHDLKELMETMKQPFSQSEVKCLMLQLLEGVGHLHENWVLHRDLKTSNLLLNNTGEVKICDFGLARQYDSPLKSYTQMVVTLWYRAPELLLGCKKYSTAVDMWSLGCIMAELLTKEPLFSGKNELDQLDKMFKLLGTPNETDWPDFAKLPGVKCKFRQQPFNKLREKFPPTSFGGQTPLSDKGFNLLNRLLLYDPKKRITVEEALKHPWFTDTPLPKMKELMPAYPLKRSRRL